jgi:hypothetical protein
MDGVGSEEMSSSSALPTGWDILFVYLLFDSRFRFGLACLFVTVGHSPHS